MVTSYLLERTSSVQILFLAGLVKIHTNMVVRRSTMRRAANPDFSPIVGKTNPSTIH